MSNKPRFTNAGVNFSTGEIHFTASGPTEPTATPAAPLDGEAREEEVATLTRELEAMRGVVEAAVKVNRAWYAYPLAARDYLPVFERKRMPELTQALSNWTAAVPPTEGETPE